jgi:hypothetical protein
VALSRVRDAWLAPDPDEAYFIAKDKNGHLAYVYFQDDSEPANRRPAGRGRVLDLERVPAVSLGTLRYWAIGIIYVPV